MNEILEYALISFTSLFVIIDPVGLIPVFLTMTSRHSPEERIKTAGLACLTAFIILIAAGLTGQWIFKLFGITLPAFEIAGGIILLLVALDMLQARRTAVKQTYEEQEEGAGKHEVAITPMAIPMLAGPGAITTVILLISQVQTLAHLLILIFNVVLISVLSFLILRAAALKSASMSIIAMKIMTRLMGLLLAAIAVQFVLNGIQAARLVHP